MTRSISPGLLVLVSLLSRAQEKSFELPSRASEHPGKILYAASLNKHQIIAAVSDIIQRAEACVEYDMGGGHLSTN